ncbi:MAG: alkaline phytoceramidase [Verrucomicrobiae bacterium]|nr:alkaline phytoceramidase [Verrucomicrobiae bacterium]
MEAKKIPTYITATDDRVPNDWRLWVLCATGILTVVGVFVVNAIKQPYPEWPAQWPEYFLFADRRAFLKVANFGDVMSNVPFLFTGAWGCFFIWRCQARRDGHIIAVWEKSAAFAMFFFIICTGIGSAYFHLQPNPDRLFWDRLPMAIVFMLFFAIVIGDRLSLDLGRRLLPVLVIIGVGSVVYWRWSEARGVGDLRPFGIVQFFPMLAIPFLVVAYSPRYTHSRSYVGIFGFYLLAKILENRDPWVFSVLGETISGHSLKHLAAGCATWFMVDLFRKRRALL